MKKYFLRKVNRLFARLIVLVFPIAVTLSLWTLGFRVSIKIIVTCILLVMFSLILEIYTDAKPNGN